ncbi:MAG: FeoA family protein [Candidatus Aerophobetes bacterium]|nr:FeoA family protein [Candidatus Aerophobetes bacterium]
MSLIELPIGIEAQIVKLRGGFGMQRHLISLGVLPGKIIYKITSQPMGGPIVIDIGGARVTIGRGIARRIMVKRIG